MTSNLLKSPRTAAPAAVSPDDPPRPPPPRRAGRPAARRLATTVLPVIAFFVVLIGGWQLLALRDDSPLMPQVPVIWQALTDAVTDPVFYESLGVTMLRVSSVFCSPSPWPSSWGSRWAGWSSCAGSSSPPC